MLFRFAADALPASFAFSHDEKTFCIFQPMPAFTYHHVFEPGTRADATPLLLLHGTGGNEHDLLRLGRSLAPDSALLSPRGDVSEDGALRFFARVSEGVFDAAEVTRRTHALADFVVDASRHYGISADRLIAVGFSNGANIAGTMLQLRPETLGGGILFRAMLVFDTKPTPGSLRGRRVLISSGSVDPLVPPDHPERLGRMLESAGAHVTIKTHAASHALVPGDVAAAQAWLHPAP